MNCNQCERIFSSKDVLHRHQENQHSGELSLCNICGLTFSNKRNLAYHHNKKHNTSVSANPIIDSRPSTSHSAKKIKKDNDFCNVDFNVKSIVELIQICMVTASKKIKHLLLDNIALKLTEEDFKSWDQHLCKNLKEITGQIYEKDTITLFHRLFQSTSTNVAVTANELGDQYLSLGTPGTSKNNVPPSLSSSLQQHKILEHLEPNSKSSVTTRQTLAQEGCGGNPEDLMVSMNHKRSSNEEEDAVEDEDDEDEEEEQMEIEVKDDGNDPILVTSYNHIEIISNNSKINDKFKVQSTITSYKFENIPDNVSQLPIFLKKAFDEILSHITRNALPHYKLGIKISMPNFNPIKPIVISFTDISYLTSDVIASVLDSLSQSNSNFLLTDIIQITSVLLKIPHGRGRFTLSKCSSNDIIRLKTKSLADIRVDEQIYCLPIAILAGKCLADKQLNKIKFYRQNKRKLMEDVHLLNKEANIKTSDNFGTCILQIRSYQNILSPSYNIVVFNNKGNFREKFFVGRSRSGQDINIFYFEDISHFVALRNVRTFFGKRFQCEICSDLFDFKEFHKCCNSQKCGACETTPPCNRSKIKICCVECKRYFYGQQCFDAHKATVCKILKFCSQCAKLVDTRKPIFKTHSCEELVRCSICLEMVDSLHQCYIQKYKQDAPAKFSMIFYDFQKIENHEYLHQPNVCVAHLVCNSCFRIPDVDFNCGICVKRQHVFENNTEGGNCVKKFIDFCEINRKESSTIFCVAHNFKAYDWQFVLEELANRGKPIKPIMGGMKIFKIVYNNNITFIDSLNFLPIPLSKFLQTFHLKPITKGWYPHFFNFNENYNYIGDVPNKKYFELSSMTDKQLIQFNTWYEERVSSGLEYNNREELIKYCIADVGILRRGCLCFMKIFFNTTSINPLLQSFTLAGAVLLAYRKKFLKDNTLGITPTTLYHQSNKNQSVICSKWLIYESKKCKDKIEYEFNIPTTKFYVDGYCKDSNSVYEFLDCYWHGCKFCFLNRSQHLKLGGTESFESRYTQTQLRLNLIISQGYKVIQIWECEFIKFLNANPEICRSLENDPEIAYKYLNPQDALYGGRTETYQMYYKAKPGEKIRYYDFKSLYPYINKTCKNPIHHPKIHYKDDCKNIDISNMDGLIKCRILPPRDLLIPVLPSKIDDKLLFTLCRTCAEQPNVATACSHNELERILIGTWVLDEVKLALNNRYKIIEIIEVWEYKTSQYDTKEKTGGIFTEYINRFLKLKQEASDWPPNVISESDKTTYINEFFCHEGIRLDPTSIANNPSLRNCSKLLLNSLWREFCQKDDRHHTEIFETPLELYSLVASPRVELIDVIPLKDSIWVNWKYSNERFTDPLQYDSLAIGPFTTANARIKLYTELSKISDNLLYCDTTSIIFIEDDKNKGLLKTGSFIGDLTDELSAYGPNSYITEFASTGPKNFAYVVFSPDKNEFFEIARCKGITQQIKSKKLLNFSTLNSMVADEEFRVICDKNKIKRQKMSEINRNRLDQ